MDFEQRNVNAQWNELDAGSKLLLLGNFATIIGMALVSAGSIIRMFNQGQLPNHPVYSNQDQSKPRDQPLYSGRSRNNYFTQ